MDTMKLLKLLCIMAWMIPLQAHISFEWAYSKASNAAQKEDWKQAQESLKELLVENPERPDLLYDTGVAAYKLKEFEKAEAYFSAVADQKNSESNLKKQALFNLANSKVSLKKLEDALAAYERALEIDSDDEKVKHNRDMVKKMLEQQQQQEQQDQDKQSEEDQNKNDAQDQNQGSNSQSQDQENKKNSSGQSEESKNGNSSETKQEEEQGADDQQGGEHDDQVDDKSDSNQADNKKDQFSDDHDSSSQHNQNPEHKKSASQTMKQDEKEQEMQEGMEDPGDYRQEERDEIENALPKHQKWMARALQKLEEREEQEQKKLIKAQMHKQAVGNNGQNCW